MQANWLICTFNCVYDKSPKIYDTTLELYDSTLKNYERFVVNMLTKINICTFYSEIIEESAAMVHRYLGIQRQTFILNTKEDGHIDRPLCFLPIITSVVLDFVPKQSTGGADARKEWKILAS